MKDNHYISEAKLTRTALVLVLGLVTTLLLSLQANGRPAHAAPTTFTVNSTADPGNGVCNATQCTLREAIEAANANPGADTIAFNIPGDGPHTISPNSALPGIANPVTIDGYTEGDATARTSDDARTNTLPQPGKTNARLKIELDGTNAGSLTIGIGVSDVLIRGLVINNFGSDGIILLGSGSGNKIRGNFIGTDPSGTLAEGNEVGVHFSVADGSTLGGTSLSSRNLISGNDSFGVWVEGGSSGNTIQGNLIGTDRNGAQLGNGGDGVKLSSSSGNGNSILSNSIFSNGGLGIDLGPNQGVNPNDPQDTDTGPNGLQNYPELTTATKTSGKTTIAGHLNSTPDTKFILQFFSSPKADPSGFGEGKTFLGEKQITTNANGDRSFTFVPDSTVALGRRVTATATSDSTGDTSEFSNVEVVAAP